MQGTTAAANDQQSGVGITYGKGTARVPKDKQRVSLDIPGSRVGREGRSVGRSVDVQVVTLNGSHKASLGGNHIHRDASMCQKLTETWKPFLAVTGTWVSTE